MQNHDKLLVSIGLPVYNGEKFIRRALDSLLAQDYKNFELIISDNASTDATWQICNEYQAKDSRIRCYRNDTNLGAVSNFWRVFNLADGEYFMWAGSHDVWLSDFISKCQHVLEADPTVVLSYTEICWIDEQENVCQSLIQHIDTRGLPAGQRVHQIISRLNACDMVYGLFRTGVLRKCRRGLTCLGPDMVLLMEVSLHGAIAEIREPGFLRRALARPQLPPSEAIARYIVRLDPAAKHRRNLRIHWEMGLEYLRGVWSAPISLPQKLRLLVTVGDTFYRRYHKELKRELFQPHLPQGMAVDVPDW